MTKLTGIQRTLSVTRALFGNGDLVAESLPIVRSIGISLGILLLLGFVVWVAVFVPPALADVTPGAADLTPSESAANVAQARQSILFMLGGLIAATGLIYTHRRHELDRDANRTDRYTSAIEQIGHNSLDVRLGGIYALERMANDSRRDRTTVADVLSAFVREHAPLDPPDPKVESSRVGTDVNAAVVALGRRKYELGIPTFADISRSNLFLADLGGAILRGVRGKETSFDSANLRGANLAFGRLEGASFLGADLRQANLVNADLRDVQFGGADLTDADLSGANLTGADLSLADLTGVRVIGARLEKATFTGAEITDSLAKSLTPSQLASAKAPLDTESYPTR